MKMKQVTLIVCAAGMVFTLGACKKKKQVKNIEKNIVEGSWKVSNYVDDGQNETSDYAGDVFVFSSNGSVTVSGTHNLSGTWSVGTESDDDSDKHVEFTLNFPGALEELADDWHVESQSSSKLELKDESGNEDNGTDYLTFEKL